MLLLNVDSVLPLSRKLNIQETSQIARLQTEVDYKIQEAISKILLALPRGATVSATFSKFTAAVLLDGLTKKQCKQIVAAGLGRECYPNHRVTINLDKSIKQINAHKAWKEKDSRGQPITGRNTKIAIVDTGVDATHPDLEGKIIAQHCFLHEKVGSCPNGFSEMHGPGAAVDENGHGTHVASIAAGTGRASGGMLRGVAPDAKLIALKVFDEGGNCLESDVIRAIEKAVEYKPDVINLSLGSSSYYYSDCYQSLLSLVVDRVVASGILVVVGAGNSGEAGDLTIDVPGCAKNAITVGASFGDDVAWFSSVGPAFGRYFKPDVVAPGVDVCAARASSVDPARARSCSEDGPYMQLSGTSMATPFVSGLVALLKQKTLN